MFRVGQKVVCVDARPPQIRGIKRVRKGSIYTVRDAGREPYDPQTYWVLLVEITNIVDKTLGELGYYSQRFRPLVERKTDISIFTKMLTPTGENANV